MKKTSFRASALICFLVLCFLFCSCSRLEPIESSEEDLRVVGTVDEFEVLYEELRFAVLTYKQILIDTYGDNIFEDPELAPKYEEMLRDSVYENITSNYAILLLCKEVGIEASDEVLAEAVQKKLEEHVEELGGVRKYKKFLKENNMTDSFFRFNLLVDIMQNELFYVYTYDLELIEPDDEAIYDVIQSEFIRTQHIYVAKNNGKSYGENKELITDAYESLQAGDDFLSVARQYTSDESVDENGFYIPKGYMSERYDAAAFDLSVGEFTEIIEDDAGFYIIKRLELDPVYLLMNFNDLKDRYQSYAFLSIVNDTQKELEFKPTEYFESLDILEIK